MPPPYCCRTASWSPPPKKSAFRRIKHDFGFPTNAIQFCLESGGIKGEDLDYVVFFEKPFRKFDRILMTVLQTYPQSYKVFRESMITWMIDKLWVGTKLAGGTRHPEGQDPVLASTTCRMPPAPFCARPSRRPPFSRSTASASGSRRPTEWASGNEIELRSR